MTILNCRRSKIALYSITILAALFAFKGVDTSTAIASIAIGIAGSNAWEKKK